MSMKNIAFFLVLILSTPVWAEAPYGIFMVVKGDVKVSRNAGSEKAKVGLKVLPGDTVISGIDARARIAMSDRNMIFVSPQTQMTIEKYTDEKNGVKNVELKLDKGKVLNNVQQKYDGEKSKFIIKTPTAVAGVRGTSFYTSFNTDTRVTEVITQTGVVTLSALSSTGAITGSVNVAKGEISQVSAQAAAPEAPKLVPPEQMKQLEGEVSGTTAPPPSAATDSSGASKGSEDSGNKKESSAPAADTATAGKDGFRMNDKKDTSPDVVDSMPAAKTPAPTILPVTQTPVNKPPTNTLIPGAIRGKTDKSNVKIIPTTGAK